VNDPIFQSTPQPDKGSARLGAVREVLGPFGIPAFEIAKFHGGNAGLNIKKERLETPFFLPQCKTFAQPPALTPHIRRCAFSGFQPRPCTLHLGP
jgi:hypothetical protein